MSQDLIMFKSLNGEEVIARLIEEEDTSYTIEKARVLATQQAGDGQVTVGLIPWCLGAPDETIEVYKCHVFAKIQVIPHKLQQGYMHQTSEIDLSASSGGLIK